MASLNVKLSGNNPPIGSPGGINLRKATEFRGSNDVLTIGTWNVRGLLQIGKTHIMEKELERCGMSVTGICETHWKGKGHFKTSNGNTIIFSSNEDNSRNGVGFVISANTYKYVMAYDAISDRIATIKLKSKPVPLNIIQVYAPTSDYNDQEIEDFYGKLEETLSNIPGREIAMIVGDFNAKVGDTKRDDHIRNVVGKYGIGVRNERGERLINFCTENSFTITNTLYQQHIRRLYTWQSPDGNYRNQIDFILIRTRWRSSIRKVKTLPGAECGSDHRLLIAQFKLKLKVPIRKTTSKKLALKDKKMFCDMFSEKIGIENFSQSDTPEKIWQCTKKIIRDTITETSKNQSPAKRQHWMSDETFDIVEARRKLKIDGINTQEKQNLYRQLSRQIQKGCRKDKNINLMEICKEAQQHAEQHNTKDLYRLIKKINRKPMSRSWSIQNDAGDKVTDMEDILEIWRKYCEKLYQDECDTMKLKITEDMQEPPILKEEVRNAIKKLKSDKSPGIDGITAEIIRATGETGVDIFNLICQKIWTTGSWPKDWTSSIFLPLFKKGSREKCDNYRLIALMSHASKILISILNERLKPFLQWQIPPEQAGFVKGRGTREQILNLKLIIEKAREVNKPLYICFIDYRKAFDSLNWKKLWTILTEMGVPNHLTLMIKELYSHSEALVQIDNFLSKPCAIRKGARQGCILSPMLFNIYSEYIMRGALENWNGGITVGGVKISNLRYADDTVLFASSAEELQELMGRLEKESTNLHLEINHDKTKIMIVDRLNNNRPDITHIGLSQVVNQFVYLGAVITNEGGSSAEVRRRCEMARRTMRDLQRTWVDSDITINTKKQIVKTLIFPIVLYGAETWTLKATDRRILDACEMWCWRRMLRVPWTARRTNASILDVIQEPQRLSQTVYSRILRYFGHVSRRENDNLDRLIVQGKLEGRRPRGRSPKRWADQIKDLTNTSIIEATRDATNRDRWRDIVRRATTQ